MYLCDAEQWQPPLDDLHHLSLVRALVLPLSPHQEDLLSRHDQVALLGPELAVKLVDRKGEQHLEEGNCGIPRR